MKNFKLLFFGIILYTSSASSVHAQQNAYFTRSGNQTNGYYLYDSGNNTRREWGMRLGDGARNPEFNLGSVRSWNIQFVIQDVPNNNNIGWTFGVLGKTPVVAINKVGGMRIEGNFSLKGANEIFLNGSNHGIGWYGSGKTFDGQAVDGPVVYGYNGGILGTRRNGGATHNAVLRWSENGVTIGTGVDRVGNKYKLAVGGRIGCNAVEVSASGWADFVFNSNYKLPTLEEVEQHIEDKGHLPSVPSECEVLEGGINLGEMDATLLQKIEELTLYAIQQNKQILNQNEQIKNLEERLKSLEENNVDSNK